MIIKPDKKAEKVPGGGLPPVNLSKLVKADLDLLKKALKEIRKENA